MGPVQRPDPSDDHVPLFGTWRVIYAAVAFCATAVMAAAGSLLAVAVLSQGLATADWAGARPSTWSAIVAFGLWVGRGTRGIDDFFLAGREMRWWAVGLSVMATQISAITFVGTTGQAYTKGMRFVAFYFGLPFAMVMLCVTLVPFFYRARVFTAYEYLERRFDAPHAHAHQPAVPALARARGGGDALRAVAGAVGDPGLERGGHDRCSWAAPRSCTSSTAATAR